MSPETITQVFGNIFQSGFYGKEFTVVWHAGEPMVLGVSYYRKAFELIEAIRPKNLTITHSFQTNGLLMSQPWLDFIKESGLKIGLSIDGPRHIHDANRKTRSGAGTLAQALRCVEMLKAAGIDFSTIAVLSDYSLDFPDEMFRFFVDNGLTRLAFNIEEVEGANRFSSLQRKDIYERYWSFMSRFWNLTLQSGSIRVLREMNETFSSMLRPRHVGMRNSLTEPFAILNIAVDGRFSTFSPEFLGFSHERYGDFCFGNLSHTLLKNAPRDIKFRNLWKDVEAGVKRCKRECGYFSICGGGSPVNKLAENDDIASSETLFCRLTRQLPAELAMALLEADGSDVAAIKLTKLTKLPQQYESVKL